MTQADEEYGRRVKEGLEKMNTNNEKEEAVHDAQELGHVSDPY
ncbi:hypothetical protein [Piscibacillus salipiscarius]